MAKQFVIVKVEVTKSDIKNGLRSALSCPISLAIRRALKIKFPAIVTWVRVDGHASTIAGVFELVSLNSRTERFVRNFDDGKEVKPLSFRLKVPKAVLSAN